MAKKATKKRATKKKATKKRATKKKATKKRATKKKATKKRTSKKKTTKKNPGKQSKLTESVVKPDEEAEIETEEAVAEEVIVGELDDDSITNEEIEALRKAVPKKFWQQDERMRALLDPTLVKDSDTLMYDLANLVNEFFDKMLGEEIIDFRISGLAIHSAAKMHHWKILDTIKEEEKIEVERQRQRTQRAIPKALPQPLRESRKVATKEDLVGAMRRAIIETMQKREKLRRRREARDEKKRQLKKTRAKGQLPKEILKHITGKGMTVEEMIDTWYERIRNTIDMAPKDKRETSLFELKDIIDVESESPLERRFMFVRMFLALCFLGTRGKINLFQADDFEDISIELPSRVGQRRRVTENA
ncbi:MAG: hypothetical protein ACTSU5_09370 [Promethearchaeota archaeon]